MIRSHLAMVGQIPAPVVVGPALLAPETRRILGDDAFVEAVVHIVGIQVHLAHAGTPVAGFHQVLGPQEMAGPVVEAVDTGVVWIQLKVQTMARSVLID